MSAPKGKPVLLDFTAEWCSTCRVLDQAIDRFIQPEYQQFIHIRRIDVNKSRELTEKYDILSIPTLILVAPSGEVAWRLGGAVSVGEIKRKLNDTVLAWTRGGQL